MPRVRASPLLIVALVAIASAQGAAARHSRVILGKIAVVEKAADAYDVPRDILVLNGDGSGLRNVTKGVGEVNTSPLWSPDGRCIAFDSGDIHPATSRVYVMNADGSGKRVLTAPRSGYEGSLRGWSPDGRWIAYVARRGIWLVAADGSGKRRPMPYGGGVYSLDGRWIAQEREHGLYIVSVPTGRARRVALIPGPYSSLYPRWSPNSRLLLFSQPNGTTYVVRPDGTDRWRLSKRAQGGAAWSRDSRWIAFAHYGSGIYTVAADGSREARVTREPYDSEPTWSPDGERIAFIRQLELWIMDRDGSDAWRVVKSRPTYLGESTAYHSPTWSPR